MEPFFCYLKRTLFALTLSVFAFSAVYVPQPWNEIPEVEAGGGDFGREVTQLINKIELKAIAVADKATAVATTYSSTADAWQWLKENALDGIAWTLAKKVVSGVVSSIVNWINSGFQGSPAFITDLPGFLLGIADEVAGEYIESLGGIGSFVCSPFRLDVQVSLAVLYDQGRTGEKPAPTCTLSGIIDNIDGFIGGLTDLSQGGWNDWFDVTARPDMYTPYGAVLTAQAGLRASLVNARGKELTIANWGDGFLSGEICDIVEGEGTPREDCFISKPGKVVQEALTFSLSTGERSLIAADEFNEIIGALLGQVAKTVITGAAGILGLSSGTGYTDNSYGSSFTASLANEALGTLDTSSILKDWEEARASEAAAWNYITGRVPAVANSPINRLQTMVDNTVSSAEGDVRNRQRAQALLDQMKAINDRNVTPPSTVLTPNGNILTADRLIPVLRAANDTSSTVTLNSLRTSAINGGVLTTAEAAQETDTASLRSLIITKVVQEFTRRTYITAAQFSQLKSEFDSVNPGQAGGGGGGTPVTATPVTPPPSAEPAFPSAPVVPGPVTAPTSPTPGPSGPIPPPPPPPPPLP